MKILRVGLILAIGCGVITAGGVKFYGIKSAKIDYEIKSSGNVMGMGKIKTIGKKRLLFDNYGARKLEEENKATKQVIMGKTQVSKVHTLSYVNGYVVYKVNFKKKEIMRSRNSGAIIANAMSGGDIVKKGEEFLEKMGGKKIGKDKVAGVSCDVWKVMGVKQCMYKGVPLKIESNIMGIKTLEIATKVEFDTSLNDNDFSLPDFDVYQLDLDKMMAGNKPEKLDKSKLAKMDAEANTNIKSKENERVKAVKGLGAGVKAAKSAGWDPKSGKEMTPKQKAAMESAMVKAMGGEQKMVKRIKDKLLADKEGMKKAPPATIECIKKAQTMKALKICFPD